MAPKEAPETAPEPAPEVAPPALTPLPEGKVTAVVVAGGNQVPKADIVIVVEAATLKKEFAEGDEEKVTPIACERHVKRQGYPTGADVYLRYDPEVKFPADAAEVLTMGENVEQLYMSGFTRVPGHINVGPAHPAYAGANLAFQRGANHIQIVGLTDAEKEQLQPFFDDLSSHPAEPAQVTVSFA